MLNLFALLIIIFFIISIITLIFSVILYELNRTDTNIKVIHVHKGKIISELEAKNYDLSYIEVLDGIIIKYYVIKFTNERIKRYESNSD